MLFELRRRLVERDELDDMYKMVSGELPNTMVVISDFPEELADSKEDVGGYNVNRQQTMMRVITLGENGKLRITTQSLDGSDRQALEAIYTKMGEPVQEGELLPQRIKRQLPEEWQDQLADNLTKTHDNSLTQQHGGEWHAGISQQPDRNMVDTYDFALKQNDLIDWFVAEKSANPARAEKLRYKLAATVTARHEGYLKNLYGNQSVPGVVSYQSVVSMESIANHRGLQAELNREEKRAARSGRVFSGCGASVKSGSNELSDGLSDGENQMSDSGYGRGRRRQKCEYNSKQCPKCGEKNVKTIETATLIRGEGKKCRCVVHKKK
jgi:hypothetical protein